MIMTLERPKIRLSPAMVNLFRLAQSGANKPADYVVPPLTDFGPAVAKLKASAKIRHETARLTRKKPHPKSARRLITT